ncbi:MAG: oligosaccharide flippase family protein [Planctomycetaceae bacterium]
MSELQTKRPAPAWFNLALQLLPRSQFVRSFLVVLTGTVLSRAVLILAMPMLARLYDPASIGSWQLFTGLLQILSSIVCARYELAVMLPKSKQQAASLFWASLVVSSHVTCLAAIAITIWPERLEMLLGDVAVRPLFWSLPILVAMMGIQQATTYWLNRHEAFSSIAGANVVRSVGIVAIPLAITLVTRGNVTHLIVGTITGHFLATLMFLWSARRQDAAALLAGLSWPKIWTAAVEHRAYPLHVATSALITMGASRCVLFLLAIYSSSHTVGLYAMAASLTFLPVTFISQSLSQVLYPRIARDFGVQRLESFTKRVLYILVIVAVPPAVLFSFHAPVLFETILGDQWREAGEYATWLTGPSFFVLAGAWLVRFLDVAGKQRVGLVLEVTYSLLSIVLLFGLLHSNCTPLTSLAAYCLVTVAYNMIWMCVVFRVVHFRLAQLQGPFATLAVLVFASLTVCLATSNRDASIPSLLISTALVLLLQAIAAYLYLGVKRA